MLKQPMGWKLFIAHPWYKPLILELSNLLLSVQHAYPMCPVADNLARGLFFQGFSGLSILIVSFVQEPCHLGKIGQRLYFFLMNFLFFFFFVLLLVTWYSLFYGAASHLLPNWDRLLPKFWAVILQSRAVGWSPCLANSELVPHLSWLDYWQCQH